MQLNLVAFQGGGQGEVVPIRSLEFSIGRDSRCDLVLTHGGVSRWHAVVLVRNGKALIRDLGSRNGTFVNGQVVEGDRELKPNDWLRFSTCECRVQMDPLSMRSATDLADEMAGLLLPVPADISPSSARPQTWQLWAALAACSAPGVFNG